MFNFWDNPRSINNNSSRQYTVSPNLIRHQLRKLLQIVFSEPSHWLLMTVLCGENYNLQLKATATSQLLSDIIFLFFRSRCGAAIPRLLTILPLILSWKTRPSTLAPMSPSLCLTAMKRFVCFHWLVCAYIYLLTHFGEIRFSGTKSRNGGFSVDQIMVATSPFLSRVTTGPTVCCTNKFSIACIHSAHIWNSL